MRENDLSPETLRSREELEAFGVRVLNRFVEKILEDRTCTRVQQATRCNELDDHARSAKGKERASSQISGADSTLMLAEMPAPTAGCVQQELTPGESATRGDEESLLDGQSAVPADAPAFDSSGGGNEVVLGLLDNAEFDIESVRWTETDEWCNQLGSGFSLSG